MERFPYFEVPDKNNKWKTEPIRSCPLFFSSSLIHPTNWWDEKFPKEKMKYLNNNKKIIIRVISSTERQNTMKKNEGYYFPGHSHASSPKTRGEIIAGEIIGAF